MTEPVSGILKLEQQSAYLMKNRQNRAGYRPVNGSRAPVLPVCNASVRTLHHCQDPVEYSQLTFGL